MNAEETKFEKIIDFIGAILILIVISIVSLQVIFRYIFKLPLSWSEEIARYFLIWVTMIGSAMAMKTKEHIRIETFIKKLPNKMFISYKFASNFIMFLFLGVLLFYGFKFSLFNSAQTSPSMPWLNMFWACIAMPIGSGLMIVYLIKDVFKVSKDRDLKDTNKGKRGEINA